jgi:hypothetical protein
LATATQFQSARNSPEELANYTFDYLGSKGDPLELFPEDLKKILKKTKEKIRRQEEAFVDFLIDVCRRCP